MNNLPQKLNNLDNAIRALSKESGFANAQKVINAVIQLFDIKADDSWKLFNDSNNKIRSNAGWFMGAEGFADRRAAYKIADDNDKNIDFKVYWTKNTNKSVISWLIALTPNFEDEDYDLGDNVGIDFIIPEKADKVIVALSNRFVVRTLDLSDSLSVTQQEIFAKWLQDLDYSNKAQFHSALWESFDFEPVNKKFFKEISGFFTELRQYLSEDTKVFDEKHSAYFTNRLIGRIVFCWFLDKKGIINPEKEYFKVGSQNSSEYYHEKLETLFFKVLNTPIEERGDGIDKITPFLNGGLFEMRENDKYEDRDLTFPADFFDRFFNFLNHYNFTTDESTSSYQQVAIDPEMLGRIFENLLAEQTEESGQQARKAKGAFYTPREIVDYMCRESLREYLKTKIEKTEDRDEQISKLLDKKHHEFRDQQRNYRRDLKPYKYDILKALDELKILDPACGSGAFPMGMLHLLLQVYERLEATFDPYKKKLDIIKNNLYGVDIEPMAVEISRLRAWLSIIVDEESDSKKIEPLPNLDFKFICANSLIPLEKNGQQAFGDDSKLEEKIMEIRDKYYNARKHSRKMKLRQGFDKLMAQKNQGDLFGKSKKQEQLESYHPFDSENSAKFFDPKFMFGEEGFNIVIGNPPYVDYRKIDKKIKKLLKTYYVANSSSLISLYAYFIEVGIKYLLQKNSILSYINPYNFLGADNYFSTRELLLDFGIIEIVDVSNFRVFQSASAYTCILMLGQSSSKNFIIKPTCSSIKDLEKNGFVVNIDDILNDPEKIIYLRENSKLVKKIKKQFNKLSDYADSLCSLSSNYKKNMVTLDSFDKVKFPTYYGIIHSSMIHNYVYDKPTEFVDSKIYSNASISAHKQEKLFVARMTRFLRVAYDNSNYLGGKVSILYNLKVPAKLLTGILNSKLIKFWTDIEFESTHLSGGALPFNGPQLLKIPISIINEKLTKKIEYLVDKILKITSKDNYDPKNPPAEQKELEKQIDKMVYELYCLTEEEIKIIESESKK